MAKNIEHYIDLFGGEKGGVGKSMVAKTAIQMRIDRGHEFVVVESDRSNPDVGNIYNHLRKDAFFTENEKQANFADQIFNFALKKDVIVNLPAQVQTPLRSWFFDNNLFEISKEYGIGFRHWFVTNGEHDSINQFVASLKIYEDKIPHILVKNCGLCDNWGQLESNKLVQEAIQKYQVKTIDFPRLAITEREFINEKQLSFSAAKEHEKLGILARQRVVKFLETGYKAFDSTGAWGESKNALKEEVLCEST